MCEQCRDHEDEPAEDRALKKHIILLSGGPGPFDNRDIEHDASWANYVTAPLLLTATAGGKKAFQGADEDVWWFIYKPAYVKRWTDDTASSHAMRKKAVKEVRDKGFTSYVDMLENRAKDRKWHIRWLTDGAEVWTKLKTFRKGSISRFHYWGHARDDLWLTIEHEAGTGTALEPDAEEVIKSSAIDASLKSKFAKSTVKRLHRFVGCNTDTFAKAWAKAYNVWTEGIEDKVNFVSLSATGGEPCLSSGARAVIYAPGGTEDPGESSVIVACSSISMEDIGLIPEAVIQNEAAPDPAWGQSVLEPLSEAELLVQAAELLAHRGSDGRGRNAAILIGGPGKEWTPGRLYRRALEAPAQLGIRIEVIGEPGRPLRRPIETGDILLRHAPGESGASSLGVLVSGQALSPHDALASGWSLESGGDGRYVQTIDAGPRPHCLHARFGRRVSDAAGRVPPGQMVLRLLEQTPLLETGPEAEDDRLSEAGTPVTVQVRNRVRPGEGVAACAVELAGTTASVTSNGHGAARLDLSGVADGDYLLRATPAEASSDEVGPALATATPRPDRIWRPLESTVTVRGERITASTNPDAALAGGALRLRLQPVWMKTPNASARTLDLSHCVVHHTGGPRIGPALETFMSPNHASAHYIIDTDGQIIKLAHESQQSWHAGASHWAGRDNVNAFSVGIEIVNRSGDAYPQTQYDALIALLGRLAAAYPALAADRFIAHSDIGTCPAPTSCETVTVRRLGRKSTDPGLGFDWAQLERAGFGTVPAGGPLHPAAYGGFFGALVPAGRLRSGDRDSDHRYGGAVRPTITTAALAELQADLACVGYWCPTTGRYDDPTRWAVSVFQERYFSGPRTRAAHYGQVDVITATTIKGVAAVTRRCVPALAPAPASEDSPELERSIAAVEAALRTRLSADDLTGIQARRQRLRDAFESVPPTEAAALATRLGQRPTSDALSRLFHYRLATATRQEMLGILGRIARAPAATPNSVPGTFCPPESDALRMEMVGAQATLLWSQAVARLLQRIDTTYWFALLYQFITTEELRAVQQNAFQHPGFLLHFIPIFYGMYAAHAEHHARGERHRINANWQGHFSLGEPHADGVLQPTRFLAQTNTSIVSGVSAHITGDMATALERAYREYSALYCLTRPFDAYKDDFFNRNREVFHRSRNSLLTQLINLGMGFGPMMRPVSSGFAGRVAETVGAGLNIDTIYTFREEAWATAKAALGQR